ncbi:hypothetical protein HK099_001153 [Clydaea vesicula]|uniref:Enoyl-CoA hydratase/isomerase domain-containing protein n=1 Tax=Clydaea vesicula TaxID=447962 RepID=A0AAD5XZT3_9FUNG|nr:hypothetical protein HK099_001153 [Clydaea vesicula]
MSGIGTHIVEEKKIDLLFEGLNKLQKDGIKMDFETIDNYIEENFSEPQPSQSDFENFYLLKQDNLKIIDTCFESYDLEKILKTLNKNIKNEFSKSTLECLESQDKLTLTATLLKLEMAAVLDFKSSLIFEEKVEKALLKIEDENLDKSKFTKKELNLFIEKNFEKILEEDQFLNNTTFNTYRWESVTSLPTKKIISEMIKGEIGGGEMARTKREVLNWFDEYWFKHLEKESNFKELDLEEEFLPKVETFNEGDAINKNVYYKTRRYAVNQWISFCIDRYCELVNDKYLKWKW